MSKINLETQKSFWKRPEGKPGAVVLVALACASVYGLSNILPTLIDLAENTLYLGVMVGVIALAAYVVMDSKVRTIAWYFYKNAIRKATSLFVEMNPIAIIEGYLGDLRDKMVGMEKQIVDLKGQIGVISKKINERKVEHKTAMGLAAAARKEGGMQGKMDVELRKAGRIEESINNYSILENKMSKLYIVIDKMKNYSGLMVEDISHEIEMKKDERKMIQSSHSVMKSAVNIINGDSDKKLMFDQAMEFIVEDIGTRIGEMERFMDVSADFIQTVDLENAMYRENGIHSLDEWSKKADAQFHNYQSPIGAKNVQVGTVTFQEAEKVKVTSSNGNTNTGSSKYF